jgi:hypothetical protein
LIGLRHGSLTGLRRSAGTRFLLSFGYPADPAELTWPKRTGGRKPLEAIVHYERW